MNLKTGIALLVASSFWLVNGYAEASLSVNAFQISKEKNGNLVKYDVRLNPDCTFVEDDPVLIYWLIQDKEGVYQKKDMNFIEKGYYGLAITKKTPREIDGQVKSLKNRDIDVKLSIRAGIDPKKGQKKGDIRCVVQTLGSGDKLQGIIKVSSIKLEDFHGEIPHELAVIGRQTETKEPVQYQISLK